MLQFTLSDFIPVDEDAEDFELITVGNYTTHEIVTRIDGEKTESKAVIRALLDMAMRRIVRKYEAIRILRREAQKQREEIEDISKTAQDKVVESQA